MRYFMQLAYSGEGFLGWQIQPEGPTVQGALEQALSRLLRMPVGVTGAGRTDTGVNAHMMVAHFDGPDQLADDLLYRLNAMVGKSIAIYRIWPVEPTAHARFDAKEREYRYFVTTRKNAFMHPYLWRTPPGFDFEAMNRGAAYLLGRQDFTSFSKLHTQVKHNFCDIRHAQWVDHSNGIWHFEIRADRFLRNMVRAIVGTLADVGRGKITPEAVRNIIEQRDRNAAGTSMPPYPLFLWDIKY